MANLTSKELSGIEDQLDAEKILITKYSMYANTTQDAQLKAKLEQIATKHQEHFDKLYSLLG